MAQSQELSFALDICELAGATAMRYQKLGIGSEMKDDGTPVTAADKECERLIRQGIKQTFPDDDILGEEEGETVQSRSDRKWIIDPIDGTYNYARGVPIFSTLLALEAGGEIVLGVVHAPACNDTFWAEAGAGAYKNGERLRVSTTSQLAESQFNFGAPNRILEKGYWNGFTLLVASTYRQRGFGDYLGFSFVFEGKAEAMLEIGVKPWDLAPMKVIIVEAGGKYSDLEGGSSIYSGSCLVSNGYLHETILQMLTDGRLRLGDK